MSDPSPPRPLLRAQELTKVYGAGATAVRAVDGVSLDLAHGEVVLVMGPSGSGKTTLLSMLGALLRPTSGTIALDGVAMTDLGERQLAALRARSIGFVFQSFNLLPSLTVEENVVLPARLAGIATRATTARARELLARLGLGSRGRSLPRKLSGGEQQRVAIARALINDAPLLLADEPTGNLDSERGQEVVMILHDLARDEGRAVLIVSHDARIEEVADRVLWLEDGAWRDHRRQAETSARVIDPVCRMRVDATSTSYVAELEPGRRWFFCSQRCLERFTANPSAYLQSATAGGAASDDHAGVRDQK